MKTITIKKPDDMHLHVRADDALRSVVPFSARQMARAIIMPNLKPPITQIEQALTYRKQIQAAVPQGLSFTPLMTLYLTDHTTPELVIQAKEAGIVAFKLYPAGATTNSDSGVTDLFRLLPTLQAMAEVDMPLLVHGEVTDENVDIFDREAVFIELILKPLMDQVPDLRIVMEHITTSDAVRFITQTNDSRLAASVTPQHLLMNRNHLLVGGVRPHHYCLPILKRESHRQALLEAVSGCHASFFFLGTDSAPHPQNAKECACGCAGIFSAHAAIELYAEAFEEAGALHQLEAFASQNGARFYRLPENQETITLIKQEQSIPESFDFGMQKLIPLRSGQSVAWSLA